jgi:hypothetical protein
VTRGLAVADREFAPTLFDQLVKLGKLLAGLLCGVESHHGYFGSTAGRLDPGLDF